MTGTVHLNGEFLPADKAAVGVFDAGWLHGAGLFETLRAENGRVFRLDAHLDRLRRSAARILPSMEHADLPSADDFRELLRRNGLESARVRLTVTAGDTRDPRETASQCITVCVTAVPLVVDPPDFHERGVQAAVCDHRVSTTDPIAAHKTTAYLPRLLGLRFAQEKRCAEALWFNTRNELAEGSISNVFLVRESVLRTPPLDTPVLPGITRGIILKIAEELDMPCEQTPLSVDDLLDAHEVFLTNTIKQVTPVVRVERHDIGEGGVGPTTRRLREAYLDLVRKECHIP